MMQLPVVNMRRTGEKISALREARGLTVRQLQRLLGFATPQTIYKWQHGETLPTIDNLVALSAILEVPISEILVTDND
ncbi:MAG: helix-turn-helix transcriptional regulator [Clostridia bacterium]|nr:helix-turn-helix transcriptional regulator [Clostridia bacterium]